LLTFIGFPHAENVAILATRCVSDDNHPVAQHREADHPPLAKVLAKVFSFEEPPFKDEFGVLEVG
jgi:hypothetical protein